VFEMAPVAMAVTRDRDHAVARVNAAFRRLLGAEGDNIVGQPITKVAPWTIDEEQQSAFADVADDGSIRDRRIQLRTQADGRIDCLVSAETIRVDGVLSTLWVYQDATEQRRNELELAAAIDEVLKDASWLSRSILDKLATLRRPQPSPAAAELSQRERQVLDLICDDLDDTAVAERLGLSRNTVRNHVASIYAKLGVNRRSGAVVWGRERGMGSRS